MAFAPFKASQDHGDKSNFQVFSDGPYMISGTWVDGKGGTFVRNPQYDPKTDSTDIRRALPDKIVFLPSIATETVYDRLIKDSGNDQTLVTDRIAPPAYLARVAAIKDRFTDGPSPFVDYLLPNFKKLTNPLVRQALATATNVTGYIAAEGGPSVAKQAYTMILPEPFRATRTSRPSRTCRAPVTRRRRRSCCSRPVCRCRTRSTSPTPVARRPRTSRPPCWPPRGTRPASR